MTAEWRAADGRSRSGRWFASGRTPSTTPATLVSSFLPLARAFSVLVASLPILPPQPFTFHPVNHLPRFQLSIRLLTPCVTSTFPVSDSTKLTSSNPIFDTTPPTAGGAQTPPDDDPLSPPAPPQILSAYTSSCAPFAEGAAKGANLEKVARGQAARLTVLAAVAIGSGGSEEGAKDGAGEGAVKSEGEFLTLLV